jgi:hypothetical protein
MKTPPTATNGKPDKPGGCPRTATSVGPLGAAVERRPGWPMMPMIQCFTEASATASATSETKKTRRICGSKMAKWEMVKDVRLTLSVFFFGFGHDLWMQNDTDDILGWFR